MLQKPLLIYLVDDDKEDRMFFREALSEIDIPVTIQDFDNGVTLMDALLNTKNTLPDAIYLDLNMPLMNGEECVEDIRNEFRFSQIPIIIYSTYVDEMVLDRLQNKGANKYLVKPESFDKLKKSLRNSLVFVQTDLKSNTTLEDFIISTS